MTDDIAPHPAPGLPDARTLTVVKPSHVPPLSLLLGFGAMLPLALGAIAGWVLRNPFDILAENFVILWGGAILTFLAGVRRGLSFRTPGGPTPAQIVTMLWLFGIGLVSLATQDLRIAPVLLLIGYISLAILDPLAARRGEAPLFFARLRPLQMLIPIVSLIALIIRDLVRAGIRPV